MSKLREEASLRSILKRMVVILKRSFSRERPVWFMKGSFGQRVGNHKKDEG
jgi:hypothetical protein